jgi:ATP-dependent RNA helicase DOB1
MSAMEQEEEKPMKRSRVEKSTFVPAITFPYKLDEFQQKSIEALENNDSVLVSAHTSAGKTTVALYGMAKALREKKRVIYTSPIKALSNQKFREFSEKFDSVGLMTGDTTIKPDSDCLVMTTEILRSMLYRGTEMMREVGCVVFDEVHYMRDKSRGVVWEETIIMLPPGCQYIFLSATIPNAREFADWVESIHPTTKVHVIHTNYRPVPLQHYLYPSGAAGIYLIVDEQSSFRADNFAKAMADIGSNGAAGASGGRSNPDPAEKARALKKREKGKPVMDVIKLVMDRNMYPVIVFSFAKKECENNALALASLNFNSTEEDALVTEVFSNAMESLGEDDRRLPAIEHLLPLLRRGVGIHHSGLLPILKEVVELLFQAGLVKVLFSTETFSMGLNMPARTVIFTSVKKFDGEGNRYLTGGEYIQMSGRAGRRGLDRVGIVIAMVDEAVEPETLKTLTCGGADVLNSSFHLTYNMVLNLLRIEDVDPEFMMKHSFAQFQRLKDRPEIEAQAAALKSQIDSICLDHEEVFSQHQTCTDLIAKRRAAVVSVLRKPKYIKTFLQAGRVVRIVRASDGVDFFTGIVRSFEVKDRTNVDEEDARAYSVDVTLICMKVDPAQPKPYVPCSVSDYTSDIADLYTLKFDFADIAMTSRFRVQMPPIPDSEAGRKQMLQTLSKLHRQFSGEIPALLPTEMGITDPAFEKMQLQITKLEEQLQQNDLVRNPTPELLDEFELFKQKAAKVEELGRLQEQLKGLSRAVFTEELKKLMRILRRLDYIDKDNLILRKARVACEITTADENEILLTELLFKGMLNDMETEMIVALLSCLVNAHRAADGFSLPEEFQKPLNDLKEIMTRIQTVSAESGHTDSTVMELHPSLMELTYRWAKGAKFIEVVGLTAAYEGDIVRMMRRLEEMLRQLAGAARSPAIGSTALCDKLLAGIQMIKRDIVFASSLYL